MPIVRKTIAVIPTKIIAAIDAKAPSAVDPSDLDYAKRAKPVVMEAKTIVPIIPNIPTSVRFSRILATSSEVFSELPINTSHPIKKTKKNRKGATISIRLLNVLEFITSPTFLHLA